MVAMGTLGFERVGIAGQISILAADLRAMVEAARCVNPGALEDPSLQDRLAKTWTEIELARLLSLRALSKIIKGEKNWPEVPFAKLSWSSMAQTLAELAVDLLGPAGALTKGGPDSVDRGKWTRLYAFQRYTTIGGGSTEVQKNIIADRAIAPRPGPRPDHREPLSDCSARPPAACLIGVARHTWHPRRRRPRRRPRTTRDVGADGPVRRRPTPVRRRPRAGSRRPREHPRHLLPVLAVRRPAGPVGRAVGRLTARPPTRASAARCPTCWPGWRGRSGRAASTWPWWWAARLWPRSAV